MILALVRHGKAEPGEPGRTDASRRLTDRGEAEAAFAGRWIAERAQAWGLEGLVRVVCSPAVRTAATARIVRTELERAAVSGLVDGSAEDARLSTAGTVQTFAAAACDACWAGDAALIAAGHNPTIGALAGMLTGDDRGVRTGEVVVVRVCGVGGDVLRDGGPEAVLGRARLESGAAG